MNEDVSPALEQFREQMRVQAEYFAENERLRDEVTELKRRLMNQRDTIQALRGRVDRLEGGGASLLRQSRLYKPRPFIVGNANGQYT